MKVKYVIVAGFLALLTGCATTTSSCGCYTTTSTCDSCGCAASAPMYPSCQCVDPACRGSNYCLSQGQCCRVFGNIGDSRDGTLVDP